MSGFAISFHNIFILLVAFEVVHSSRVSIESQRLLRLDIGSDPKFRFGQN